MDKNYVLSGAWKLIGSIFFTEVTLLSASSVWIFLLAMKIALGTETVWQAMDRIKTGSGPAIVLLRVAERTESRGLVLNSVALARLDPGKGTRPKTPPLYPAYCFEALVPNTLLVSEIQKKSFSMSFINVWKTRTFKLGCRKTQK